jgi:hypothetical protein
MQSVKDIRFVLAMISLLLLAGCTTIAEPSVPMTALPAVPPLEPSIQAPLLPANALDIVLLEVRLDNHVLSEAIIGYQTGGEIFLPLGELSQLLTLAITTQPEQGTAHGYVINEKRGFNLDISSARLTLAGQTQVVDLAMFRTASDDIYIASILLTRWLPIDLHVNLSSLTLQITATEQLPLQERFERERLGARSGASTGYENPGYPLHVMPYRALSVPFIDQTIEAGIVAGDGHSQTTGSYTGYLTADLLGLEAALFINSRQSSSTNLRFTLGRNDPGSNLLGPLRARAVMFGSAVLLPSVTNIATSGPSGQGYGLMLSNRPADQPSSFDRHSLQGDLPPGWDVELYFNDALVGFQNSRADGRYNFDDQPMTYGSNEFRLVFRGPLGQQRVERQSFLLEQSGPPPGTVYYTLGQHQDPTDTPRSVAKFEWGLNKYLTTTGAFAQLPALAGSDSDGAQQYTNMGLRAFWRAFILDSNLFISPNNGLLSESGLKTQLAGVAISYSHIQLTDFTSELFLPRADPLRVRDTLRLDGTVPVSFLPRLPVTFEIQREQFQSGIDNLALSGRVAAYINRTSLSNKLSWQAFGATTLASGALQFSRRAGDIGISGQFLYSLKPQAALQSLLLSGDKRLGRGYRVNTDVVHTIGSHTTLLGVGMSKSLGSFGLSLNSSYSSRGDFTAGLQFFVGMNREPRQARWHLDALPKADSGATSVRVFLDNNANGVMDYGEELIQNVAITQNGGRVPARTDSDGIAWLDRLPSQRHVDIAVDAQSLEDPFWVPQKKGVRLVPRAGQVAEIDFPIVLTSEIDGTVYWVENQSKRGIGNVLIELLNEQQKVVSSIKSSSDGYYIIPEVPQGRYSLRVSPEQLQELGLMDPGTREVTVLPNGEFVSGVDFILSR